MINLRKSLITLTTVVMLLSSAVYVYADSSHAANGSQAKVFGIGQPFSIEDLPPGRVKSKIASLPLKAQQNAIKWLQRFSFSVTDLEFIEIDNEGGVFYSDNYLPEAPIEDVSTPSDPTAAEALSLYDVFSLHSLPGAQKTVFLDFDGHTITNTAWNIDRSDVLEAKPYDLDGDPTTFSQNELNGIAEIWHRVSEDFAPFEINVTTEAPSAFNASTGHVLITKDVDANGVDMPARGAGGVAYVDVFGSSYYPAYSPAFIYYNNLGNGWPPYVAEAASHEFGHNLGLSHDGNSSGSYYSGHGNGYTSWGPIMGAGYYSQVTQWSKGEYSGASNPQDDVAIIANKLSIKTDDHGDTIGDAGTLTVDSAGNVLVTSPEDDPHNSSPSNKGTIETDNDVDYFWFSTGAGEINLTVTPAWRAFYRDTRRGANLDVHMGLYDATGFLVTDADPFNDTDATIFATVGSGTYYLAVTGVGNSDTPYSDYGSLGQYYISGTITPGNSNNAPVAMDDNVSVPEDQVTVIPVLDNDSDSDGEYLTVISVSPGSHGTASTDAVTVTYAPDADFHGSDSFTYTIRDEAGNLASAVVNVTVLPQNDTPDAVDDWAETAENQPVEIQVLVNDTDIDGDQLQIVSAGLPGNGSVVHDGSMILYTPDASFTGVDVFSYTISDGNGGTASANVQVTVTASATLPQAPGNLMAADNADGTASLTWGDMSDNEDGFEIQRESQHKNGRWNATSVVADLAANTTSYTDNIGQGVYRYRARAYNGVGYSEWTAFQVVEITGGSGGGGGKKDNPGKGGGKK